MRGCLSQDRCSVVGALSWQRIGANGRNHARSYYVETWLSEQNNMLVCYMDYGWVVGNPVEASRQLVQFARLQGDPVEMAEVVNKSLYRQKVKDG